MTAPAKVPDATTLHCRSLALNLLVAKGLIRSPFAASYYLHYGKFPSRWAYLASKLKNLIRGTHA